MIDVLLSWGTARVCTVPVDHHPRTAGKSNYTLRRLINHGMLMLTGYSTAPLRFASLVGFTFTLFGLTILAYVVLRYLLSGSIPGFPFLASIISIFSGAQLFVLGIMGEYLARMFNRSVDRPTYVIKSHFEAGRILSGREPAQQSAIVGLAGVETVESDISAAAIA